MYVHVVKKGETLHQIGRSVGVSREEIVLINRLHDDERLVPGSSLLIPTGVPTSLITYRVRQGDTLRSVARRFHMPEKIITAANQSFHDEMLPAHRVLTLPVPIVKKREIEVNMRLEVLGIHHDLKTIKEAKDSLSSCSVATAFVKANGSLQMPKCYHARLEPTIKRVKSKALLLITPEGVKAAVKLLRQEENRRTFFADLRTLIAEERFDGVHLEFTVLPPVVRSAFLAFVRELSVRLKQMRGLLYVAVPPHNHDDPESFHHGAFDLSMIAQYADRVVWNVEESYGGPDSAPMALAPLHLIRRSLGYALEVMPASKLLLGLPFYGYDWPMESSEDGLPNLMLHGFAGRHAKEEQVRPEQVHWDDLAVAPMYSYRDKTGDLREVWYEDVRSVAAKLNLVHELGLAGVSCRVFENEWSVQWSLLVDTFQIEKGKTLPKKHLQ